MSVVSRTAANGVNPRCRRSDGGFIEKNRTMILHKFLFHSPIINRNHTTNLTEVAKEDLRSIQVESHFDIGRMVMDRNKR